MSTGSTQHEGNAIDESSCGPTAGGGNQPQALAVDGPLAPTLRSQTQAGHKPDGSPRLELNCPTNPDGSPRWAGATFTAPHLGLVSRVVGPMWCAGALEPPDTDSGEEGSSEEEEPEEFNPDASFAGATRLPPAYGPDPPPAYGPEPPPTSACCRDWSEPLR